MIIELKLNETNKINGGKWKVLEAGERALKETGSTVKKIYEYNIKPVLQKIEYSTEEFFNKSYEVLHRYNDKLDQEHNKEI